MKSKWFIQSNSINGKKLYIAARLLDNEKIAHSGNVEHSGIYTPNLSDVQELVDALNKQEDENE